VFQIKRCFCLTLHQDSYVIFLTLQCFVFEMLETSVLLGYVGFEAVLGLLLVNIIIYSVYFAETAQWNFVSISNNVCYLYLTLLILLLYCFFDSTNTNILNHGLQQCVNSHFFAILSIFSSILSLLFLSFYLKKTHFYKHEYITVCLLSIIGMVILSKSTGFINIYLGLELQSIAFYVLATFFLNSKFSVESGIKYFITGSFISCVLVFSFALLYLVTGSLDLECYQNVLVFQYYNLNISLISVVFIIFCLLFKIGCFPFHYILCDVYEVTW
jgi:NADH-quinone oxidoreductase subunit N